MLLHGSLATSFVCVRAVSVGASGCFVKFEVVLAAVERSFQHGSSYLPYVQQIQTNVCIRAAMISRHHQLRQQ